MAGAALRFDGCRLKPTRFDGCRLKPTLTLYIIAPLLLPVRFFYGTQTICDASSIQDGMALPSRRISFLKVIEMRGLLYTNRYGCAIAELAFSCQVVKTSAYFKQVGMALPSRKLFKAPVFACSAVLCASRDGSAIP